MSRQGIPKLAEKRLERTHQQLRRKLSSLGKARLKKLASLSDHYQEADPALSKRQNLLLLYLARALLGINQPKSLMRPKPLLEPNCLPVFYRPGSTDTFLLSCVGRSYVRPAPGYRIHVQPKVGREVGETG